MIRFAGTTASAVIIALALTATPAHALFHLWTFSEFFSSADGSVQFIEMHSTGSGETVADPAEIRTTTDGNVFGFPENLTGNTLNRRLLIGTENLATLPGGVTPDYTIPANFFDAAGDTIRLFHPSLGGEFHSRTFSSVPTDGVMSLNYPGATTTTNSPTNYSGMTGSIDLSPTDLPGDFNDSGAVENADLTLLLNNWGAAIPPVPAGWIGSQPTPPAIDNDELTALLNNWGNVAGAGQSASATVPEPATALLAGMAIVCCARCRRGARAGTGITGRHAKGLAG